MGFKQEMIAIVEAAFKRPRMQRQPLSSRLATTLLSATQTIMFISLSMGFSLLVNAWLFFRITGGLFNPAVTLALWLIGGVSHLRAVTLTIAQILGGIAGAALVAGLLPYDVSAVNTVLQPYMSNAQGVWLEAFLTAVLVFSVLMLAAEKHKATYIAPVGIGLTLFVCQLVGTLWTGCSMNFARSFGPAVVSGSFPTYFWIYFVGPTVGAIIAVAFYVLLKLFDYQSVLASADAETDTSPEPVYMRLWKTRFHFFHHSRNKIVAQQQKDLEANGSAVNGQHGMQEIVTDKPVVLNVIPTQDMGGMSSPMAIVHT